MPIEIRELYIKTTDSPRKVLARIIQIASSGPAGFSLAARGVVKLASDEEGFALIRKISQKFTLFNESGTPLRSVGRQAYPIKWQGPSNKSGMSEMFNPKEFTLSKSAVWSEAKARSFVMACLGKRG